VFVSVGVVIETLFNVIMPLSLKFLIDDALGEEDFPGALCDPRRARGGRDLHLDRRGMVRALGCSAGGLRDRRRPGTHLRPCAGFAARPILPAPSAAKSLSRFSIDLSAFEGSIKSFSNSAALPFLELIAGMLLMVFLNWQLAAVALLVFPITLIGPRILTPKAVAGELRAEAQ